MKKLIPLFFIFTCIRIFSQEYHFDYFIKQNNKRIKPDNQQWVRDSFYDSATKSQLFLNVQDKKIIGTIYQEDKNIRHVFKVFQKGNNLNFTYKYSNQFDSSKRNEDYNKDNVIKIEKLDSLNYKIVAFKNSRLKKKQLYMVITLEKSDFDYINISADYNRTDEMEEKLKELINPDFRYRVKREQIEYSSGYVFDNSLENIQKVDLVLNIPEKIILKEYNYWSDFEE
ncbi:hypothetical protein [uncultured Chryseobacterium sp.]|uniref:hypothetical protein n=1 Tax=uncultured Chryseobacterium sp. TaxID=259322 RepID=UPI0025D7DEF3|nr:hypothetical protein [uncultured Chryseobacterium sp.]